jgi:pimeloyl-ACP methyl ester carboxylesterase
VVEAGIAQDDVLALAVFTTEDPVAELALYRDWMHAEYAAPTARESEWMLVRARPTMEELRGKYGPVPVFQDGEIPYQETGGAMEPGRDGAPIVHSEYDATFTLTVPTAPMPAAGYPLVLYAHGTGGDHRSFVSDGTAARMATLGIAAMGIDQIHHGDRNPTESDPELLFFNLLNAHAARDNNRQSALDVVQQARLVSSLTVPVALADRDGVEIHFDPERVFFFGHSQGGLVAPLFLGIDDGVSAAVISAGGAVLAYALLEKTEPVSIPGIVRLALVLPGATVEEAFEREGIGFSHPVISLVQGWIDASDGSNFGHLAFVSPRLGFPPKSILSTEGLLDAFSPPGSIEALAVSMRVPLVAPVAHPIDAYELLGVAAESTPLAGNVASGAATAGLLQYPEQGHFAVFEEPAAQAQIDGFLRSAIAGTPMIPPRP